MDFKKPHRCLRLRKLQEFKFLHSSAFIVFFFLSWVSRTLNYYLFARFRLACRQCYRSMWRFIKWKYVIVESRRVTSPWGETVKLLLAWPEVSQAVLNSPDWWKETFVKSLPHTEAFSLLQVSSNCHRPFVFCRGRWVDHRKFGLFMPFLYLSEIQERLDSAT